MHGGRLVGRQPRWWASFRFFTPVAAVAVAEALHELGGSALRVQIEVHVYPVSSSDIQIVEATGVIVTDEVFSLAVAVAEAL